MWGWHMGQRQRFALMSLWLAALLPVGVSAAAPSKAPAPAAAKAEKPDKNGCQRAAFRVLLDVGDSAEVPGAFSARGVPEYDFNMRLARNLEKSLLRAGFRNTQLLITPGAARAGLFARVARSNT